MLRDHVGEAMLGKKKISLFYHVARSCWGSHVGEAKKLAFFPMLRDHVGEAMFGCPMVRDHRLAVPLRDQVGLSQHRCGFENLFDTKPIGS